MTDTDGRNKRNPQGGLPPRKCKACGEEFIPYRSNHLVCGRSCRAKLPAEIAKAKARQQQPEVRERTRRLRRLATANDPERIRLYNLRGAMKRYGVTLDWYMAKLDAQSGACVICGHIPPPGGTKSAARLHVDHNHESGAVRDLLCTRCNQGLGYFRENPDLLRAAADYLDRHRS